LAIDALVTRPARKPRTMCGAHPVAPTICGSLAPPSRRSIARSWACFVSFGWPGEMIDAAADALIGQGDTQVREGTVHPGDDFAAAARAPVPRAEEGLRSLVKNVQASGPRRRRGGTSGGPAARIGAGSGAMAGTSFSNE
jgi:hypothetical protein